MHVGRLLVRARDWAQEVAFVDALLAILDDRPVDIPFDNPYAADIQQDHQAIEAFQSNIK